MRAHFALFYWMMQTRPARQFPRKPLIELGGVYQGSVVWQYFMKQKTSFKEIVGK
jgi:hypothetical protein